MRGFGTAFVLAGMLAAGPAFAAPPAASQGAPSAERLAIYICDGSSETKRALIRLQGSADYVTAEEAMAARKAGRTWSAPRCMTDVEYERLKILQSRAASLRTTAR